MLEAHRDDPEYGYRLLAWAAADAGEKMCEPTAWKVCRDNQWWSVFGKKRAKNGKRPSPLVHDDLVQQDFAADDVNELWLSDITKHPTDEGKVYLCAIKDVFSGRIVGYPISDPMKARLAVNGPGQRSILAPRPRRLYRAFGSWISGRIQLVVATP